MAATTTLHAVSVIPVKVRNRDDSLTVDVSRVIGYKATCRCGWASRIRSRYSEAVSDAKEHRLDNE